MASFTTTPIDELPAIDDLRLKGETRYEIIDGELVYVPPADLPHASLHAQVSALIEAHAAPEFEVSCDMLMRVTRTSEIAPDVSVLPRAKDPRTGGSQVAHLAFEVVNTQSLGHVAKRAILLTGRGVRRVFAIQVERQRALEWSISSGTWTMLDAGSYIEDPALAAPLPVSSLIRIAGIDDVVARALLIKRNAVLDEVIEQRATEARVRGLAEGKQIGLAEGKQIGLAEGKQIGLAEAVKAKADALLVMLGARGISLQADDREKILGERDHEQLDRWIARAATCTDIAAVLANPPRSPGSV
jgi:hypothetical protein